MHAKAWITAALVISLAGGAALANPEAARGASNRDEQGQVSAAGRLAAGDMRLTSEWMARSYEIPARVPQEILLEGHSYSDCLIALALMGKGASLNELMELRCYHRWDEIAQKVEIDPETLPDPIRALLHFGRNELPERHVLHFLPDVYVGLERDLKINAFTPVVPGRTLVKRFQLDDDEVRNIRTALDDPFGVSEELLRETGGRGGLVVGDWVLAGVLAHHKPFGIDSMLAARAGEGLSWSEICLAFGLRPDVLTKGPLSGIYPVLTGATHGTVMCARRRRDFPPTLPVYQDISHLTPLERNALYPLMIRAYRVDAQEQRLLEGETLDMMERGIAVALARLARTDLAQILEEHRATHSWTAIVNRHSLDMTGQLGLREAILVRETPPPTERDAPPE